MSQVTIPGVGAVDKKYVYIGSAAVAGIVGYAYWSARQGNAGAAATPEAAAEDTDTDGLEPAGPGDYIPATDYSSPVSGDTGSSGSTPDTTTPVITDNVTWARAAVSALTDVGVDTLTASTAVGRYLAGLPLSASAADLVRQAQALVGVPPVGDHPIKLEPVTTPNPSLPSGSTLAGPGGLKVTGKSKTTVSLAWNPVKGAEYYRLYRKGVSTNIGSSEDGKIKVGGLRPATAYTFHVRAVGHDGKYGKPSASVTVKTSK